MGHNGNSGKGAAWAWLRDHVSYQSDECLIWPFCRDQEGYPQLGISGKLYRAIRVMCELAHGKPPTAKHQTGHSCGNGKSGCVNPRHLSWKTHAENQLDRRAHGTHVSSRHGWLGKLTQEQIDQIRALNGKKPRAAIARMFNISRGAVYYW